MKDIVYLDNAGAAVYYTSQIVAHAKDLQESLLGNPHSHHPGGLQCDERVRKIRQRVLEHFGTDESEYSVVFTRSATDSIRIVHESFDFVPDESFIEPKIGADLTTLQREKEHSLFAYLQDNHTSIIACRELVISRRVRVACVDETAIVDAPSQCTHASSPCAKRGPCLFAFPSQVSLD